ncbi:MAG: hypothetical protein ACJ71N_09815 [Terriglobales bacterium]
MFRRSAIALLLLLPCSLRAANQSWMEVRTPHLVVTSDAGEKKVREVGLRFEQMRSVFGMLLQRTKVNIPVPTEIVAFATPGEMEKHAPSSRTRLAGGFFEAGEDKNFIGIDASSENPYAAVFHDYAHMLLDANYPRTQPWFDEGFAEYFSAAQLTNKEIAIGAAHEGYAQLLTSAQWMPLAELFKVPRGSKVYDENGDHRSLFYAESWAVAHYVFDKNKLQETAQYFNLVENQKMRPGEAIPKAFGMDAEALLKEVQNNYRTAAVVRIPTPEALNPDLFPLQKLPSVAAQARLADVHAHSPNHRTEAAGEFEAVLKADPNYVPALLGLGYLALQKKDFASAAKHFKDAITVNAKDARVLYYSAVLLSMRQDQREMHPSDPALMETYLVGATNLYSDFAAAWNLLAEARLQEQKPEPAIAAAANAVQLGPRNENYEKTLGEAYIAARQWDNASYVFSALKNSDNETVARDAEDTLREIETAKAGGKFVSAKKPSVQPPSPAASEEQPIDHGEPAKQVDEKPDTRPVKFIRATLAGVFCDGKSAVLQLALTAPAAKGAKSTRIRTMKMLVPDIQQVILINADTFSCDWRNQKVGLNYKEGPSPSRVAKAASYDGDVVSIEMH